MILKNAEFWPTPEEVIHRMLLGVDVRGKVVLEPSAGSGHIVTAVKALGAKNVIACEKDEELRILLRDKCRIIAHDFMTVSADAISHVDLIIMNPPFWNAHKHIMHAWEIAPAGCIVLALCNTETLKEYGYNAHPELVTTINTYGHSEAWGNCFSKADRPTDVQVSFVRLNKPATSYEQEFEGFFIDEEPEEAQEYGVLKYDAVRDIVNRYVAAVKLYDQQLELGAQMSDLVGSFPSVTPYGEKDTHEFMAARSDMQQYRAEYKKSLQKRAWKFIFDRLDMDRYSTKGLREDINKFIEQQQHIPFTMRNIYQMLEIVVGTTGARMDKALLEVFDKLTRHYDENRYGVEGWKTNSDYLLNRRFIKPYMCNQSKWNKGSESIETNYSGVEELDDVVKALCYMTGEDYSDHVRLSTVCREHFVVSIPGRKDLIITDKYTLGQITDEYGKENVSYIMRSNVYGEWFDWSFFRVKAHKKGTMHFEFKDENIWATFNQNIARIKGYPLYEANKKRKEYKGSFTKSNQEAA